MVGGVPSRPGLKIVDAHGAGGDRLRHARDLDQAHAAIAGDRQALVIAEARDLDAGETAGLDQRDAVRHVVLFVIDDELRHASSPSSPEHRSGRGSAAPAACDEGRPAPRRGTPGNLASVLFEVAGLLEVRRQQIVAMRLELDADRNVPFLRRRHLQDLLAGIEDGVDIELVFLEQLDAAVDGALLVVELREFQRGIGKLRIVESEPQRLAPQFIGIGAALGALVLGDLQMRVDQAAMAASGHHQRSIALRRCPRTRSWARYSAATGTEGASGFAACASMRSSMTWRKWRISPCTGQAAASPRAQMVWPST